MHKSEVLRLFAIENIYVISKRPLKDILFEMIILIFLFISISLNLILFIVNFFQFIIVFYVSNNNYYFLLYLEFEKNCVDLVNHYNKKKTLKHSVTDMDGTFLS